MIEPAAITPLAGWSDRAVNALIWFSVAFVVVFLFVIIAGASPLKARGTSGDAREAGCPGGRDGLPPQFDVPGRQAAGVSQTPTAPYSLNRVNNDQFREVPDMSQRRSNTERSVEIHFGALAQAAAAKAPAKRIAAQTGLPWRTVEDRAARPRAGLAVTLLLLARWDRALGEEIKRFIDDPGGRFGVLPATTMDPQPESANGQNQLCERSA